MTQDEKDLEAYRQAGLNYRHFSVLRFTVVTTFVTISNFLLTGVKDAVTHRAAVLNVAAAVGFSLLELNFNRILRGLGASLSEFEEVLQFHAAAAKLPDTPTDRAARMLLPSAVILALYASCALAWVYAARW